MNWGIIGAGRIAKRMAQALQMVEGAHLYAVGSRSGDKAAAFAKEWGFAKSYGSYEDLYNDPAVDIVYVATPHNFHAPCAIAAMEHGKHVLIEKPMTVNEQQARQIIDCAQKQGVFCMEALWIRFLPLYDKLKAWFDADRIGEVKSVYGDFSIAVDLADMQNRLCTPLLAGGALLDLGVYPINFAAMFLGSSPAGIEGVATLSAAGVDANDAISLLYPGGQTAVLRTSLQFGGLQDGAIAGTKGVIRIGNLIESKKAELYVDRVLTDTIEAPYENGFQYQVRHVEDCIAKGMLQSDVMPLAETLRITRIMDALREKWGVRYPFE